MRSTITGFVLFTFVWFVAASASAQPSVTVVPDAVSIAGTRSATEVRNLSMKVSAPVQNLKITAADLVRTDQQKVLLANRITATLPQTQIAATEIVTVPIQFDLKQASSGEYAGVLFVQYAGGETTLPVIVKIKDPPGLALLMVLLGVGLGYLLRWYQAEGFDRDEILVQVGRIRTQMQGDQDFQTAFPVNPFQIKTDAFLVEVDTKLEDQQWEAARQAANSARSVWDRWRKGKPDWLRLLKYKREELDARFGQDLSPHIPYGKGVQNNLELVVDQMADDETPEQFRQKLEDIRQQIDRYLQGKQLLAQLGELESKLDGEKRTIWRTKLARLQNNLDYLRPTDQEGFIQWQTEAKQALDELSQELLPPEVQRSATTPLETSTREIPFKAIVAPLQEIPLLQSIRTLNQPERAKDRLGLYQWTGRMVSIIFLAGLGFNQLYLNNLTFGANRFSDYFALLAWGFGAEVTRESATKVLQSFRLPESKTLS